MKKKKGSSFILSVRANELFFNEDIDTEINNFLKSKVNVNNAAACYYFARNFKLSRFTEVTLKYIERCFTVVADTRCFHELDFSSVAKILSSNELHVDSELQVIEAAISWWKHDENERSKFLTSILLKTRFHLISEHASSYLLSKMSFCSNKEEFAEVIKKGLENKKLKSRYCHQNEFDLVLCGGKDLSG